MRDWWQRTVAHEASRLRTGGKGALLWSLRITVAAVASYVAATLLFPGSQPLLAPLTAMLVVQVTPVSLLASGLDRVVAVVAGVTVAVTFAAVTPLAWWSLGLLILVAILVGQALHLRDNLIEVAISGMLVLGVGSLGAGSAAWERVAETLVGAGVGIAANLLFPPKVATTDAGRAIQGLAERVSGLLTAAAERLDVLVDSGGDVAAAARDWLGDARRITHDIPQVGAALLRAEQGRRLNVRATVTGDAGPGLRQGLEALEHSAVAVRSMARGLADTAAEGDWLEGEVREKVLRDLSETFRALASALDAFGRLVCHEAEPGTRTGAADVQSLLEAVEGLEATAAKFADLDPPGAPRQRVELNAVVLSTVRQVLHEVALDERIRRQVRQRPQRLRMQGVTAPQRRPPMRARPPRVPPPAETELMPPVPAEPDHSRDDERAP